MCTQTSSYYEANMLEECSHPILTAVCNGYSGQALAAVLRFLEGTLFPAELWFRASAEEALECDLFSENQPVSS